MSDHPDASQAHGSDLNETGQRIGAKAWIRLGDEVLLIRECRVDGSTFWTLPGGGIAPPETLRSGLARELGEELQCQVVIGRPMARCTYEHSTLDGITTEYTVFRTWLVTPPSPNPRENIVEMAWADPASPPTSLLEPFRRVVERVASPSGTMWGRHPY